MLFMLKIKRICIIVLCMLLLAGCAAQQTDSTAPVETEETENESRTTEFVWFYKEENGKIYRRLYCSSTCEWVTDWILCE